VAQFTVCARGICIDMNCKIKHEMSSSVSEIKSTVKLKTRQSRMWTRNHTRRSRWCGSLGALYACNENSKRWGERTQPFKVVWESSQNIIKRVKSWTTLRRWKTKITWWST
jgi:hypothetical protein